MSKKKFKDTKVGTFLKLKAPNILAKVGDLLPDKGVIGIIKNLITKENPAVLSEFNSLQAGFEKEMEMLSIEYEKTISDRWSSDMASDSWLSKNARPMTLIFLLIVISVFATLDSIDNLAFQVSTTYIDLFKTLLVTVVVAYFGSRGMEKYKKIST